MTIEIELGSTTRVVVTDQYEHGFRTLDIRKWMLYPSNDAFYPSRKGIRIKVTDWPKVVEAVKQLLEEPNKPIDKPV